MSQNINRFNKLNFDNLIDAKEKRKKEKKKGMYKCSQCKFSVKYQSKLDKHCFEKHAESRLCIQVYFKICVIKHY